MHRWQHGDHGLDESLRLTHMEQLDYCLGVVRLGLLVSAAVVLGLLAGYGVALCRDRQRFGCEYRSAFSVLHHSGRVRSFAAAPLRLSGEFNCCADYLAC